MAPAIRMEITVLVLLVTANIILSSTTLSSSETILEAKQSDCENVIPSLSPCIVYITQNSSPPPSSQCCRQIENVLQRTPICLCDVLNQEGLNKTRVLALPKACNIQTPPPSRCNSTHVPGSPGSHVPPLAPPTGYSTKISHSLLLSGMVAATSCAGISILI